MAVQETLKAAAGTRAGQELAVHPGGRGEHGGGGQDGDDEGEPAVHLVTASAVGGNSRTRKAAGQRTGSPPFGPALQSAPTTDPSCLTKTAAPASLLRAIRSRAHPISIGRAFRPLSPPIITQSIPRRSSDGSGPIRGSSDR